MSEPRVSQLPLQAPRVFEIRYALDCKIFAASLTGVDRSAVVVADAVTAGFDAPLYRQHQVTAYVLTFARVQGVDGDAR
jgi:hypothetical protein